jgi:putative sporulation protein YyaC
MNLKQNFQGIINKENIRIPYSQEQSIGKIGLGLASLIPSTNQPIVFICIGTDRSTGDSLGPLIGTKLVEKKLTHFHVYGTLDEPIHAVNLLEKLNEINLTYNNPFIIGIDASLGRMKNVGIVTIGEGPVKPGAGVNKELVPVGDIHITGIVNVSGFMEFFVLQNTRLSLVMKMAEVIASGIYLAEESYTRRKEIINPSSSEIKKNLPY